MQEHLQGLQMRLGGTPPTAWVLKQQEAMLLIRLNAQRKTA